MKKKLLQFALLITSLSFAQQATTNELEKASIGFNFGGTNNGTGYNLNIQRELNDKDWGIRVDFNYLAKQTNLSIINNNVSQKNRVRDQIYMVGAAVNYSFKNVISDPFYFYAYLGGHYSNQIFNYNKMVDCDCYKKPNPDHFGFYGGVELQYRFSNRFSLVAMYQLQQNFNSDIEKWQYLAGGGLKYNF
ncbi:porin family protein [Flavobacterium agricola]|uniref:Porin family protein n=1 Tax=Flavobacterium agricola TaxID=2870839 RepID=A0ABY6M3T1_9FLAO|nr:porin family protein [Flavobacterium agricola]UYW01688.1 porin family protein [Flavobacterium agricola]